FLKPRLKSSVESVAVLTYLSFSRVSALNGVCVMVSPGSVDVRLAGGGAEAGFQEVEVTAFIGLGNMADIHPAKAALEAGLRLDPCGSALRERRVVHHHVDASCRHVDPDAIARP